ncbi:MAG TPA: DUF4159 domain-containing protein [Verrucomicrobiae bacterium]|jgi:hypothetical protein
MRGLRQRLDRRGWRWAAFAAVIFMLGALVSVQAQYGGRRGRGFGGGGGRYEASSREHLKEQEMMTKAIDPAFAEDVFTFGRLRFDSDNGAYGRGRVWADDVPEADLNLIFRLYQVTSLKVRPGLNFVDITIKDLANYPFVYMAGAGRANFSDEEATALREYLLNGGFLMVDDFWGDEQWEHFREEAKLIFPNRQPELMDLTHPIFHTVYQFKKQPQIPSVGDFAYTHHSYDQGYDYGQMNHDPHYFGIYDDKRRLMMLICHNNHYGDGWEHEGDDTSYFDLFSMPMGYPMLLNILAYTMSH